MEKNIYTALSGALAQERVLDIIANNIANANTVGFKEEQVSFKLLEPEPYKNYKSPLPPANFKIPFEKFMELRGNDVSYVGISNVFRNDAQGSVIHTGNPLDVMIEGNGYFTIQTQEGPRFTRNGSFSLNPEGALVDKHGQPVLGENGVIFLRNQKVEINPNGEIYENDVFIDRLQIVSIADPNQLEKVGFNYMFYSGAPEDVQAMPLVKVSQGDLEGSNVNAMKNLTSMIIAHRSYEAYQRAIKNFDQMMEKSSNELGVLRA